jgi:hypothetical protein
MRIKIRRGKHTSNACYICPKIFEVLGLKENKSYTLHVGHFKEPVQFKAKKKQTNSISLPSTKYHALRLVNGTNLNVWKVHRNIYIGPVVGIFVNTRYRSCLLRGDIPFSARKEIQANRISNCLIYYFSIDDINFKKREICGCTVDPISRTLVRRTLPFPNVIYDRGVKFKQSQKSTVKWIREKFRDDPEIQLINNVEYLGKWQLYERLNKYWESSRFLPQTVRYTSLNDLTDMLRKHRIVFVKTFYGSRGREVMSIERENKHYKIMYYQKGIQRLYADTIQQIAKYVQKFIAKKPAIIQQGIDLVTFNDRRLDLRVLITKDGRGKWKVIYNQANVAKSDATITTIGKDFRNYKDIYPSLSVKTSILPTDSYIRRNTIRIAKIIEKEFGSLGEMGMDMAVDQKGKLWFIEANSKPQKNPIPGLEDRKGISPQFLYIFEYAKYLAKRHTRDLHGTR